MIRTDTFTRPTVEQAEADAVAAEAAAAELRAAVEDGDDTVTPAALAEAEQVGMFARLRITAARRRADADAEADRHARADAVAAEVRRMVEVEDPEGVAEAIRAASDALAALYDATAARRARVLSMAGRVQTIQAEALVVGIEQAEFGRTYGVAADADSVTSYRPSRVAATATRPEHALAAAVGLIAPSPAHEALVTEAMGMLEARVETVGREVPAMAAALVVTEEEFAAATPEHRARVEQWRRRFPAVVADAA